MPPLGNEREIIGGRGRLDVWRRQIGISGKIETSGPVLNPCDDQLLDGVKADCVEPDRLERRADDNSLGKHLRQPQGLYELAFATLAHAPFHKPAQMRQRLWQCPALEGRGLIEGARLLLEQRQIVTRFENEIVAGIAAGMTSDLDAVAENDDRVDEPLHQDVAKAILGWNRVVVRAIARERQG
jgi:hypothetical protein